jgi:hypothetical protein
VFVLPHGPWNAAAAGPAPGAVELVPAAPPAAAAGRGAPWRGPLLAAVATLAVLVPLLLTLLPSLGRSGPRRHRATPDDVRASLEAGRQSLAEGNFQLAAQQLTAALDGREANGEALNAAENRQLNEAYRQADLLARLSGRSLEEILLEALPVRREEEWQARFRAHHRGKAVAFDDVVRHDAAGRPALAVYVVRAGGEVGRVALEDLELLKEVPLDPPRRLLFGGRLADVRREPGGGWVFHFDPDSGVLLTDAGAVTACLGPPDLELREVLQFQQQWLAERPSRRPVPRP